MKRLLILIWMGSVLVAGQNPKAEASVILPHIAASGGAWETLLLVDNLEGEAQSFRLALYNRLGTTIFSQEYEVNGLAQLELELNDPVFTPGESGLLTYDTAAALSFRLAYRHQSGGAAEFRLNGEAAASLVFQFGTYYEQLDWKGVAIHNPGAQPREVSFSALDGEGNLLGRMSLSLGPRSRKVFLLNSDEGFGTDFNWRDCSRVYGAGDGALAGLNIAGQGGEKLLFTQAEEVDLVPYTDTVRHDTVVIGAGIAGLTAAWFLRDRDVVVLEKESVAGGKVLSGSKNGFVYAKGTEYLGEPEGALATLLSGLGLTAREIPAPLDTSYHDGSFFWGDEGIALMFIEGSSLDEFNRIMSEFQELGAAYENEDYFDLMDSDLAGLDEITARQWFQNKGFGQVYQDAFNVASRGLFGASLDEISALSMIPEFAFDFLDWEPVESADDLTNAQSGNHHEPTETYSFVTGITEVIQALANSLGERIQTRTEVTAITPKPDGYEIIFRDENGALGTMEAAQIILAVPPPVALAIASQVLTSEQRAILGAIPYASYATAALFSETPIFDGAFDLAVPDGWFFTDIYDSTWVQRRLDPNAGSYSGYIAGIYAAPDSYLDQEVLQLSDEALLQRIYTDLDRIFPGASNLVTGYDIQRFPYAYPVMTTGAYGRLTRLEQINTGSLILTGDYTRYPTFEAAVASGMAAAQKLITRKSRR